MNALKFGSVLMAGLWLGACHPVRGHGHIALLGHPNYTKILTELTCPDDVGALQLAQKAADGRSCRYGDARGDEVDLSLLALNGASASQALLPTEAALKAALPSETTAKASGKSEADGDKDDDDDKGDHDHTHVDLPGLHIDADGDKAHVRLPGWR